MSPVDSANTLSYFRLNNIADDRSTDAAKDTTVLALPLALLQGRCIGYDVIW